MLLKGTVLVLLIHEFVIAIEIPLDYKYNECSPKKNECEFWLEIKEKLTMIYKKDLLYSSGGSLFLYNESPGPNATKIPLDDVISADGENRMVIVINGTLPGPPIVVYEHQNLIIHVKNMLLSDVTTLHWHGLHQKGTPFMDGVGWISQCPISAGQTFTYKFKAEPKGTFWYHSHVGSQRTNGAYGAFIIKEREKINTEKITDVIMTVGDWHHKTSEEVYLKMVYGNFIGMKPFNASKTVDGGLFSGVPWVSALIEGKGRYIDPNTGKDNGAPLTWYTVKHGLKYRFRSINVGTIYPMRISVDGHEISVVASDGYDIKPYSAESVIVHPGERFDFILNANKTIDNYWIRAESMEDGVQNHSVEAILHYEGASNKEPSTRKQVCLKGSSCKVVNCPFKYFPEHLNLDCVLMSDLHNADDEDPSPIFTADSEEYFLNFAFPGSKVTPGAVNGRKFEFPGVNSLTQGDEIDGYDCNKHDCGLDKVCYCHYELKIPRDKTIQMIFTNIGSGAGWGHPIHLHGHSFYVLKMDYAPQNTTTAKLINATANKDIDCGLGQKFCNEPKWKNKQWDNGNIPGLNLINPPRKDTLIIPTGGYAVLRFKSDNPGKWFLHCHIEVHALDGMAMIISEAVNEAPKPPKGFPVCNNFYHDLSRDFFYIRDDSTNIDCTNTKKYLAIAVALFVLLFVNFVTSIVIWRKYRQQKKKSNDCKNEDTIL
ncbi:uncharacterized protein LOC100206475 isoform X2 [Hydra vulgaris]|uniref:Uncharacterized protein LOC100206475 isoform X2 n=1 Tax=Hydra vulgaris TaxID=6087 RepID=A0ABM4CWY3_HYDVU